MNKTGAKGKECLAVLESKVLRDGVIQYIITMAIDHITRAAMSN